MIDRPDPPVPPCLSFCPERRQPKLASMVVGRIIAGGILPSKIGLLPLLPRRLGIRIGQRSVELEAAGRPCRVFGLELRVLREPSHPRIEVFEFPSRHRKTWQNGSPSSK